MSSKTKIVVVHMKELIYTGIFVVLGILLILLLIFMFLPKGNTEEASVSETQYVAGVYSSSIVLNDNAIDVEVVVDENHINSIRLVNLSEAVTTMYPLLEPSLDSLTDQILESQSLDDVTYSQDNQYTSIVLLNAIQSSLEKAAVTEE